ncbi:MAG: hypothetical protein OSB59_01555 [Candidatus Poseidoniia archaeon]|jgi:hypothetical protein|nr:hypothetical protein [Candidatus Poseidoniia archaeon]|tara:strand:+ start:238 stop:939 length:702 start_codon:yes stop_codon:yes gene_type:complete
MDSVIFQANVIGMLMYIIPAMLLFFYIIKGLEDRLMERKLYLASGIGVVLGSIAEVIMLLSGTDLYTNVAYASMILVTPFIIMMFMFIGVNLKTFKDELAAPYYSAGYGLFFGGTIEFWKLLITESRYSDMSIGDFLIITLFGLGTVVFLGGAGMWIAYAIKNDNGIRVTGRLAFLYLFLQYLYASALEHVHYGLHDFTIIIASIIAFFAVSGALFHQGYLRLPKIAKTIDGE